MAPSPQIEQPSTCAWCNAEVPDIGAHFASWAGKPCRIAALAEQPVQNLDGGRNRDQIRRAALRDLQRTNRRDRLEGRVATNAPPSRDPQGRV